MDEHRILHIGVDRQGRTWRVLEREDGSTSVYYSKENEPTHYVVYDELDPPATGTAYQMVRRAAARYLGRWKEAASAAQEEFDRANDAERELARVRQELEAIKQSLYPPQRPEAAEAAS